MPLSRPASMVRSLATPSSTTKAAHFPSLRKSALDGTVRASRSSQTTILASTRKPCPSLPRDSCRSVNRTTTFTLCSSTPRAETLVNANGSIFSTMPFRGLSPPQPDRTTRSPDVTRTASEDRSSMTTSSPFSTSPTSIRGVPADRGPSLSRITRSTRPSAGAQMGMTFASVVSVPAPLSPKRRSRDRAPLRSASLTAIAASALCRAAAVVRASRSAWSS